MVSLLSGQAALTPMGAQEQRVLRHLGAPAGVRLACQCRLAEEGEPVVLTTGYW
jgi:ferredoxin